MTKRPKKKPESKPITAQPLGSGYAVHTSTSLKPLVRKGNYDWGPSGSLSGNDDGCYRRVPRLFND
jgi:hypothetical protein